MMWTVFTSIELRSQYISENFDNLDSLWAQGWVQQNRSTPSGGTPYWFQGDPGQFSAFNGGDTAYIAANYDCVAGSNTISLWLFTPERVFSNGEKFSFYTRTVNHPNYPDRMQFRLSLNGASTNVGTTSASVGDFSRLLLQVNPTQTSTGYPNQWTRYTLTISGLTAPSAGRAAFRYYVGNGGPGGNNSEYIGIDSFAYFLPPPGDLLLYGIAPMEYTQMPVRHPFPGPFVGRIENYGSTTVANAQLKVNIFDASGAQVYTNVSPSIANMAPGERDTFTVPAPTALPIGSYKVQYIAEHNGLDGDHENDTLVDFFAITAYTYARDNGDVVGDIGIGAYVGGYLGQSYRLYQPDNVDSIWVHVTQGHAGHKLAAVVWDMVAGVPGQIVGRTDTLLYATDSAADYTLPLHGGRLQLPAGDFVVTMIEFDSTLHIGMAADVFTRGTIWMRWPTLPTATHWANVEVFGLPNYNHAQMIRPIFSACDLLLALSNQLESTPGAHDGTATVVASGGTPPYTYQWSTGAITPMIVGLGADPVFVTVTDASGCRSTGTQSMVVGVEMPTAYHSQIAPNPNHGRFTVLGPNSPEVVTVTIFDLLGQPVTPTTTPIISDGRIAFDLSMQPPGIYFLQLRRGATVEILKVIIRQ